MASRDDIIIEITPQVLLKAYSCGIFPMAESADDPALYWIEPQQRGILPLDTMHVPKRLARTVRTCPYEVRIDSDFEGVITGCAASRPGRRSTWINERIRGLYRDLFEMGYCHTVEVWADGKLSGGLYGVALGGAFFGESMFSTVRDASKIALVHLASRLLPAASRCSIPNSSPTIYGSSARSRSTATTFSVFWRRRCGSKAISCRCRRQPRLPRFWQCWMSVLKPRDAGLG